MKLFNLIFPKKCMGCDEFLKLSESDVFCPICRTKYEAMKREKCRTCSAPHVMCRCIATKLKPLDIPVTERHVFAFDSELSRTLIYRLKRKNLGALRLFLARECAEIVKEETARSAGEHLAIVFPPRSKSGIKEYGFDQAHIIATEVSKITGIQLLKVFKRAGGGKAQKTLSAKDRAENAEKSFKISEKADISGKIVIIIDDVVTSGSTAARLSELSKLYGAKRIIVVSAAKT